MKKPQGFLCAFSAFSFHMGIGAFCLLNGVRKEQLFIGSYT